MNEGGSSQPQQLDVAERTGTTTEAPGNPALAEKLGAWSTPPEESTNPGTQVETTPSSTTAQTTALEQSGAPNLAAEVTPKTEATADQSQTAGTEATAPAPEAPQPNPTIELQNMVDRFQKAVQDNPAFITTVLEQATGTGADGVVRSLADLPIVDLTALLVVAEQQSGNPGETTASLPIEQAAQIDQLRAYVLSDATAVELYYPEHYRSMDATQVAAELTKLTQAPNALADCGGTQLCALREAVQSNQAAYDMLALGDPKTEEATQALEQEWQAREGALAAGSKLAAEIEIAGDPELAEQMKQISPDATITGEVKRDPDTQTVSATFTNPDGTETEVQLKEISWVALLTIVFLQESLFGSSGFGEYAKMLVTQNVLTPFLAGKGYDPSPLFAQFEINNAKYAMDSIIEVNNKSGNSEQINDYLRNSLAKGAIYQTLLQINPIHLRKMFAQGGTQRFGTTNTGFSFTGDHLQVDQQLVNEMRSRLTDSQLKQLGLLEEPPAQPPTPQQTPVSQSQPQAAPTT